MELVLANRYRIIREIGRGGTGIIYLAEDLNLSRYVAMKQLMISGQSLEINRNEVDLLKTLHHSNLPQVYDYICISGQVYTVVEYISGCDLTAYLPAKGCCSKIPEEYLVDWLLQLCVVLEYLHSQSVIHSDIKPGNIMITSESRVMLIDFNISFLQYQRVKGYSDSYASPEQLSQARAIHDHTWDGHSYLDARTDLYSLAATFYHLISGQIPAAGQPNVPLTQMNLAYTKGFLKTIDRAMAMKPSRRYSSAGQMKVQLLRWQESQKRGRKMVWQQLLLGGGGLLLITAGLICILIGSQQNRLAEYNSAYRQISSSFQQWDLNEVFQLGTEFLEDERFEQLHRQHPERTAEVYALLGESEYWQAQYALAAEQYQRALSLMPQEDYVKRCVISLLKAGSVRQAEEVVWQYGSCLTSDQSRSFLQAEIAYQAGDYQNVLDLMDQDEVGLNADLLELGVMAAQALNDLERAEQYIERCYQLTGKVFYLRWQGETCYLLAKTAEVRSAGQRWTQKALSCYQSLCENFDVAEEDRLWMAILLIQTGDEHKAKTELQALANDSADNSVICRANLYLTLLCYQSSSQRREIRIYCDRAIRMYNQLNALERRLLDENDLMQLEAIGKQYGCAILER